MRVRRARRGMAIVSVVAIVGAAFLIRRRANDAAPPTNATPAPAVASLKVSISYDEARPILDTHRASLPAELNAKTPIELESFWPAWVSRHNTEIRSRLERGDEDSIVNLWLYGTTFTTLPRATDRDLAMFRDRARSEDLLLRRLDDLVAGLAAPGGNERLRFARQVVERHGIDPTTPAGGNQARAYLVEARERTIAENQDYRRTALSASQLPDQRATLAAFATLFRDRGLSSDTSISADFALDQALGALTSQGKLGAGSVRRVAIVGPGLDFTDKAEGYDFYPQQTIQPFAVIDSLIRLNLSKRDELRMTTFDLSPRVNQHLEAARQRARGGDPYVLQLPLSRDDPSHQWNPDLVRYWRRWGDGIGDEVPAIAAPAGTAVQVRAVRVAPSIVMSIIPRDVNIVLERMAPLAADERFDLIVATNILVYYDAFDQSLALANVSSMLRPGGFFLTNYAVVPAAPMESSAGLMTTVAFDRQHNGDTLFSYQRH